MLHIPKFSISLHQGSTLLTRKLCFCIYKLRLGDVCTQKLTCPQGEYTFATHL